MVKNVIKEATGDTASNHIRRFVIRLAKNGVAVGKAITPSEYCLGIAELTATSAFPRKTYLQHVRQILCLKRIILSFNCDFS